MCMSRLYRVLRNEGKVGVDVEDLDGIVTRASLLALEGPPPVPGDWVVVHSGYVIDRVDDNEAENVVDEVRRGQALVRGDDLGVVRS